VDGARASEENSLPVVKTWPKPCNAGFSAVGSQFNLRFFSPPDFRIIEKDPVVWMGFSIILIKNPILSSSKHAILE
jgi:hypothetical protein